MLVFLTLLLMMVVGYAFMREGLATSICMFFNVILAGLVAFNLWEPLADQLEELLTDSPAQGLEDFLSLGLLFALALGMLRLVTNQILPTQVEISPRLEQGGSIAIGLFTGYLVAGFLLCVLQTLPWHERFMNFTPHVELGASTQRVRRWMPPDRVWLAMMRRASVVALSQAGEASFDPRGTFEVRYARHRRYADDREALPAAGETDPGTE